LEKDPTFFGSSELEKLREISRAIRTPVPPHFVRTCEVFLAELMKWNGKMNLISRRDERRVIERHLLDSLCLLSVERNLSGKRLLDVGSGAGFPGVVLAIWEPNVQVFLLESRSKKIAFLNAARRLLALDNVCVVHSRIETLSEVEGLSRSIKLVVSRGVGGVFDLADSLVDIVAEDGLLVLYKGSGVADELEKNNEGARLKQLGFELEVVRPTWQELTTLVVLRRARH
jgi:16S rRNA (guanine527-N7)-methyltransferase